MAESTSSEGEGPSANEEYDSRMSIFDSYICNEPAGDVPLLMRNGPDEYTGLLRTLQRSAEYFSEKDETRVVERIHLEQALLHMQHKNWKHALRILLPLWPSLSWRKSGWWLLLKEVDRALDICARHVGDADVLISVQWELLNSSLTTPQEPPTVFSSAINALQPLKTRPRPTLRADNVLSTISARLAFTKLEGNVGLPLTYQLVLTSHARPHSAPLTIARIQIVFEGSLTDVRIDHGKSNSSQHSSEQSHIQLQEVDLEKRSAAKSDVQISSQQSSTEMLLGCTDLELSAGQTKVLGLSDVPRVAEDVETSKIILSMREEAFDFELVFTEDIDMHQSIMYFKTDQGIGLTTTNRERSSAVKVLPKPPKLRLELADLSREIFTSEILDLAVDVVNGEDEEINVDLELEVHVQSGYEPAVTWLKSRDLVKAAEEDLSSRDIVKERQLGKMLPSTSSPQAIQIQAASQTSDLSLIIRANYNLASDPHTPVFTLIKKDFIVRETFECTHTFSSLLHPEPWPPYFEITEMDDLPAIAGQTSQTAHGLVHRWSLISRILSTASLEVVLDSAQLEFLDIQEAAQCEVLETGQAQPQGQVILPGETEEKKFFIDVQKVDIEDRRPTYVNSRLRLTWHLKGLQAMVSYLPIPELAIAFGEPRVLASICNVSNSLNSLQLDFMVENPSVYTLTFNVMMDTNEDFAFTGAKNMTIPLVPLSRRSLRYIIFPLVRGTWINPQLRVYDVDFHKTLKVQGVEHVKNDKKGINIWIDSDE